MSFPTCVFAIPLENRLALMLFPFPWKFKDQVLIPTSSPDSIFLGPMGDLDPLSFINAETLHIPFKISNVSLEQWSKGFRLWPSYIS
jgi:hypothetical protein